MVSRSLLDHTLGRGFGLKPNEQAADGKSKTQDGSDPDLHGQSWSSTRKLHLSGSFASRNVPIGSPTATSLPPTNATFPVHFA